jgi:hypothetical protein
MINCEHGYNEQGDRCPVCLDTEYPVTDFWSWLRRFFIHD